MNILKSTRSIKYFFKYINPTVLRCPKKSTFILHKKFLNHNALHKKFRYVLSQNMSDDSNNFIPDDTDDISYLMEYNDTLQQQYIKHTLYPNSSDPLIKQLCNSESIQEVFDVIKVNIKDVEFQHISQAILVLWDLQKTFLFSQNLHYVSENDPTVRNYMHRLITHPQFQQLIHLAKQKSKDFDADSLGCFLLYITKMGVVFNQDLLKLYLQLQKLFKKDMSLTALSRIIVAVRSELNFSSLFLSLHKVPFILKELDNCNNLEDLKLVTICLNHLHQIVTDNILDKYMEKVKQIIEGTQLDRTSFRSILKILSFLHYPQWSNKCSLLSSELLLHMKDNIHLLNVFELFLLFEILFKNQEPAEILTEMQRCAAKLFLNLEEEDCYLPQELKLKLLSCIICFSSPLNRHEYESIVRKFLERKQTSLNSIYDLLRILTFIKPSDTKLCKLFWDNVLEFINKEDAIIEEHVLLRLCLKYMNSTNDMRYRHKEFERQMMVKLENYIQNGIILLIPCQLSIASSFILSFGTRGETMNTIIESIIQNWTQFNYLDCLYISKGIRNLEHTNPAVVSKAQLNELQNALNKCTNEQSNNSDSIKNNFLLKSCIYRKCSDRGLIYQLLHNFDGTNDMSSPLLRNIVFGLQTTDTLLPNLMEKMCSHVVSCKNYVLGFNAEKIAYLCYYLGYYPKNYDQFFDCVADIIIRDQERISGLSYIQAALALCFFNKLPNSFIKHIFNVNFLEKIDSELTTCYFKDRYPVRVRNSMMQLNRAVCLDIPEVNVPWFHQKFIQDNKRKVREHSKDYTNIKLYLLQFVEDPQFLAEDVSTAYGYHIDFLLEFDNDGRPIKPNDVESKTKLAVLIINQNAYTNVNVQLKGKYQMKKRHLEILGYKVVTINTSHWNSLVLGEEKLRYLNNLVYPTTVFSNKLVLET